jgi:23S rRNA (uridine2552-2'-O)-methyltransferase
MYRKDQKHESYTMRARKEGYPARSIYKLKEIDEKYKIIEKGYFVLDLGCAPGSWLLYISEKVGDNGKVIGVDREDLKILPKNNIIFIKKSVFDFEGSDFKGKFNAVVSDMAPNTSSDKSLDSGRSLELAERSLEIAKSVLIPGGNFICKIFEGEDSNEFFKKTEESFKLTRRMRPRASISKSKEFYIVAKGFKSENVHI